MFRHEFSIIYVLCHSIPNVQGLLLDLCIITFTFARRSRPKCNRSFFPVMRTHQLLVWFAFLVGNKPINDHWSCLTQSSTWSHSVVHFHGVRYERSIVTNIVTIVTNERTQLQHIFLVPGFNNRFHLICHTCTNIFQNTKSKIGHSEWPIHRLDSPRADLRLTKNTLHRLDTKRKPLEPIYPLVCIDSSLGLAVSSNGW